MRTELALVLLALCAGCAFAEVAPYPYDDRVTMREGEELRIDVLENDVNADRVGWFAPVATGVTSQHVDLGKRTEHGMVRVLADQTVLYTPEPDFHGTDSFYYVAGNSGGNTRARVEVEVVADSTRFGEPIVLHETSSPLHTWPATLDHDLAPDVVTLTSFERARIEALRNGGDFELEPVAGCCEGVASKLLIADLDDDGLSDVVALGGEHGAVLHLNRTPDDAREPVFELSTIDFDSDLLDLASVWPSQVVAGNFGAGPEPDLAFGFASTRNVVIAFDVAASTAARFAVLSVRDSRALAAGDVTDDGLADIVVLGHDAVVRVFDFWAIAEALEGEAREASIEHPVSQASSIAYMQVADVDQDSIGEIVIADGARLIVLAATVDGQSVTLAAREVEANVRDFALVHLDGDGYADLLTIEDKRRALVMYRGHERKDGVPGFELEADFPAVALTGSPHVVDFDQDGVGDVLATRCPQDTTTCQIVMIPGNAAQR